MVQVIFPESSLFGFGIIVAVFGIKRIPVVLFFAFFRDAVNIRRPIKIRDLATCIIAHSIGYYQCIGRCKRYIIPEVRIARKCKIITVFA